MEKDTVIDEAMQKHDIDDCIAIRHLIDFLISRGLAEEAAVYMVDRDNRVMTQLQAAGAFNDDDDSEFELGIFPDPEDDPNLTWVDPTEPPEEDPQGNQGNDAS